MSAPLYVAHAMGWPLSGGIPSASPAGTTPFREWIADTNTRYVTVSHQSFGGIAYQLLLGNGSDTSTPPTSIGAPFGGFRIDGAFIVASKDTDPTIAGNRTQIYSDIGSIDAAMQLNGGLFGGNYHGGIVFRSSNFPASAGSYPTMDTGFDADVTWPGGETARIIESMAIQSDGSLLKTISYTSSAVFTHVYFGLIIGTNMTQYSTDGSTWTTTPDPGGSASVNYNMTDGQTISFMRDPVSGRACKTTIISFNSGSRALKRYFTRKTDRLKDYAEFSTGGTALGSVTATLQHQFYQTTPDPTPSFTPITDTYDGTGSLPTGYTNVAAAGGTQTSTLTGGVWQLRAGATPANPALRYIRPITGALTDGVTVYRVEIDYATITAANSLTMYLKGDNGASNSTGILPFSMNGGASDSTGKSPGLSTTAATGVMTFTLPSGVSPYIMFEVNGIAGRGINISETRITQP